MVTRLSTAIAALLVAVWLGYQGLVLLSFARSVNAAYTSTDLLEVVGTVTDTSSVPIVPRDTVLIDQPVPGIVQVVPDSTEPVTVGQPRTMLVDQQRTDVARYKHAEGLTRPGDRYYLAGGLAIIATAAFGVAGVRVIFRVASQRSPDIDEGHLRFAGHHRHGA